MPLLPIDLQTLFAQSNQVGKEQAVQKEATAQAQALQGTQLARQTETRDKAVNETQPQPQGPEQVKTRLRRNRDQGRQQRERAEQMARPPQPPKEHFIDPALGRNVDLTG